MAAHSPKHYGISMTTSFAQIRRFLRASVCAFALHVSLAAPVFAQVAVDELGAAQQAVARADQADADQYAPELLASARQALAQAQAANAVRRERRNAPALAQRASADADLALAKSREAVALARLQQARMEIAELQRSLGQEQAP